MSSGARLLDAPDPAAAKRAVFLRELDDNRADTWFDRNRADPETKAGAKWRALVSGGRGAGAIGPEQAHRMFQPKIEPVWPETLFDRADPQTPLDRATHERRTAEAEHFARAEAEYLAHAESETGLPVDPKTWRKTKAERAIVRAQSKAIAAKLEESGRPAYRSDKMALWVYGIHSGSVEQLDQFRRICLIPSVAATVRAPKLAALEYYLDRNPFCRFWTFTSGTRCQLRNLRSRVRYLHGRLNRLAKWLRKEWKIELVFRSTEFGTLEFEKAGEELTDVREAAHAGSVELDAEGQPLFHPHSHCVIRSLIGYRPPEEWKRLIRAVSAKWKHHWDAGKIIGKAREACKYVTKPGDLMRLEPAQLGELADQVSRLKLCQPLGALKREMAKRRADKDTLRRVRTPDGMVWKVVGDQNRYLEAEAADREAIWELHEAKKMAAETKAAAHAGKGSAPLRPQNGADFCRVMARLSPGVGPAGIREPRVVVGGTRFDLRAVRTHPLVEQLWSATVQAYLAGSAISVHTGTPTGPDGSAEADGPPLNLEFSADYGAAPGRDAGILTT
jgi:hypothetical protein